MQEKEAAQERVEKVKRRHPKIKVAKQIQDPNLPRTRLLLEPVTHPVRRKALKNLLHLPSLMHFLIALLIVPLSVIVLYAQETPEFHEEVEVDLVNVYLSAVDSKGNFINDLRADELTLSEDDGPQQITNFSDLSEKDSDVPLVVAFLMDTSISMNEGTKEVRKIDIAKNAASLILDQLRSQDRMMLLSFNTKIVQQTEVISEKLPLSDALKHVSTSFGRTALFDALDLAIDKLDAEWGRKIIVICSDGEDNASEKKMNQKFLEKLNAAGITVVALGTVEFKSVLKWYGDPSEAAQGKANLQKLADVTGGYAFFPSNLEELDVAINRLRGGVWNWYSIGYSSTNPVRDGSWRKIKITCKRRGVKLKYREGYFAH